jgi:hypothetical protein
MKLITAQEVAQEQQQLSQRLTAPGPERGANDALYLKRPNVKATNKDKVILRALGKEQYRGQAQVEAGEYQISVGFHQWPVQFSAGEAGTTTFLYDHRVRWKRVNNPRSSPPKKLSNRGVGHSTRLALRHIPFHQNVGIRRTTRP